MFQDASFFGLILQRLSQFLLHPEGSHETLKRWQFATKLFWFRDAFFFSWLRHQHLSYWQLWAPGNWNWFNGRHFANIVLIGCPLQRDTKIWKFGNLVRTLVWGAMHLLFPTHQSKVSFFFFVRRSCPTTTNSMEGTLSLDSGWMLESLRSVLSISVPADERTKYRKVTELTPFRDSSLTRILFSQGAGQLTGLLRQPKHEIKSYDGVFILKRKGAFHMREVESPRL